MATMRDQRLKSQDEVTALREHYAKLQRQWAAALEEATRGYAELKQHHFDHHRDLEDAGLTKQHLAGTGEVKAALAAARRGGREEAAQAQCAWCRSVGITNEDSAAPIVFEAYGDKDGWWWHNIKRTDGSYTTRRCDASAIRALPLEE